MATYGSLRRAGARFDSFHVDLISGELLRSGVRVPIQDQPLQVLRLLLEAEGKVVTREQLRAALWPEDTFVDFEHGVNTAVKKLRQALEDSAERPKFVETLPRFGCRFIVPVEWVADAGGKSPLPRVVLIAPGPTAVPPFATSEEVPRAPRWRWRFAPLAIALLLLAGMGGYLLRPRPQIQPDKLTIVPFTTFPGFEIGPSFSPDGNQIVFAWFGYKKEYQFDLYIKQVGQERVVQLTHHPATFLSSAWSPDGRFIAFMRYVDGDPGASGIYVISALGGSERKLASITPYGSWEPIALSWSADGKWLAFAKGSLPETKVGSSPEHFSTHLLNVETTEERALPDPSHDCVNTFGPAFSPDGKYLASVCVLTAGVAKIYLQTPMGKKRAKWLTHGPQRVFRVSPGQRTASHSSTARTIISGAYRSPAEDRRSFSSPRMWNRWRSRTPGIDSPMPRCAMSTTSGDSNWPAKQNLPVQPPSSSLPAAATEVRGFRRTAGTLLSNSGAQETRRSGCATAMAQIPCN